MVKKWNEGLKRFLKENKNKNWNQPGRERMRRKIQGVVTNKTDTFHTSVLSEEVLEALNVIPGEDYLDATLGGGGHTGKILNFGGKVVALDFDDQAITHAIKEFNLKERNGVWVTKEGNLKVYQKNFTDIDSLEKNKVFSGLIFDLGASSFMFDSAARGFSFSKEAPLDMRMDKNLSVTASDLLNGLNEGELYELFSKLGEEHYARRIARDVKLNRIGKKVWSTLELADLVCKVYRSLRVRTEIHPATKVFMALRLAVNDELNNLREALPKASERLKKGGRMMVISFHSLEDKIVKDFFKGRADLRVLTGKPILATEAEVKANPRSRSAKMRVAEKI